METKRNNFGVIDMLKPEDPCWIIENNQIITSATVKRLSGGFYHDAVLGSTYTHHIYRNQLSRNEGATLAINSSTLDKLLKQSSNGNVFVVFSCLDRFGKK